MNFGGKEKMRKESIGRLLLTLITAFVMVAGVFGAAVTSFTESPTEEQLNPIVQIAGSGLDMRMDEAGEAPASVNDFAGSAFGNAESASSGELPQLSIALGSGSESGTPGGFQINSGDADGVSADQVGGMLPGDSAPLDQGTRAVSVDANGPYGEMPPGTPYVEGDDVTFDASIAGGLKSDYKFRWDIDDNDEWDGPGVAPDFWGAYDESSYTHSFNDNHIGEALVEAWDGVSYKTIQGGGNLWDERRNPTYYHYSYYYGTVGMPFRLSRSVTIDQLGMFRYSYPYQYYNVRLWTGSGTLLRSVSNPYVPNNQWRWFSVTPITVGPGDYVVSVGFRGYYQRGTNNPGTTADGVLEPLGWSRYPNSYTRFPSNFMSSSYCPFIDVEYAYTYQLPDVLEDAADVFVDNSAPVAVNPQVVGEPGQEGSEVGFDGALIDAGTDDEWEYRWTFGDGTDSGWRPVLKWAGGAKILLYHSIAGYENEVHGSLASVLGNWAPVFDIWSFYTDPGTLEMLLEYDVLIFPENTGIIGGWPEDVGDLLADYVDAGGAVVDMVPTFMNGGTWGITGRWADEQYSCFVPMTSYGGAQSTNVIYDPTHPIIDGPAGVVSGFGTSIPCHVAGIRPDSTLLADYPNWRAAAYKPENAMGPGSGRIVSLNIFILSGYRSGDALEVTANAAIWASQAPAPGPIPMPIPLATTYHVYRDDHPDTLTPIDTFDVKLEIRDDDHGRVVGGAMSIVINEIDTNVDAIELYNYGPAVDLTGWVQYNDEYPSQGLHTYNFPSGFVLQQGAFVHLHENGNPANLYTYMRTATRQTMMPMIYICQAMSTGMSMDRLRVSLWLIQVATVSTMYHGTVITPIQTQVYQYILGQEP
jgi:hypothetical protein